MTLDLNCDLGELKPGASRNFDAELMPYLSSCNVACGFHSGNPELMEQTMRAALAHGVQIGAHPSYNDRENFGRASVTVPRSVLLAELRYQIAAAKGMAESLGAQLHHVKPHGALYNDLAHDRKLAADFIGLVQEIDPKLKIYLLAGSPAIAVCRVADMVAVAEGFADRRYQQQDRLRSRQYPDAVLHEAAAITAQIDDFLAGQVRTAEGEVCKIAVESICLHSDTPDAVRLGKSIHDHLRQKNVHIAAVS
ncbi:MAG: 5-oxoprolinase subunit PxpA [Bacteroidota bacterium]